MAQVVLMSRNVRTHSPSLAIDVERLGTVSHSWVSSAVTVPGSRCRSQGGDNDDEFCCVWAIKLLAGDRVDISMAAYG